MTQRSSVIDTRPVTIAFLLTYWSIVPTWVGGIFGIRADSYEAVTFSLLVLIFLVSGMRSNRNSACCKDEHGIVRRLYYPSTWGVTLSILVCSVIVAYQFAPVTSVIGGIIGGFIGTEIHRRVLSTRCVAPDEQDASYPDQQVPANTTSNITGQLAQELHTVAEGELIDSFQELS